VFTRSFCAARFVLAAFGATLASGLCGQSPSTEHIPQGWYVYPNSKLKHADESTLRCFNFSHNEWYVSLERDDVKITKRSERKSDTPLLPPQLKLQPGMPGGTVNAGLSDSMHFASGWLLAYDAGEFGGGLWLTNEDGSETRLILSDNVRGLVPLEGGGVLVLSGLAHMSMDFGNEFIFSKPEGMNIPLQYAAHLDGAPRAFTKLADGSVLFVTTQSMNAITTKPRKSAELNYFPKWMRMLYPNSILALNDGTIFIGMRMLVLRLTPSTAGYNEGWLLPNSCRKFETRETDCVCKP